MPKLFQKSTVLHLHCLQPYFMGREDLNINSHLNSVSTILNFHSQIFITQVSRKKTTSILRKKF